MDEQSAQTTPEETPVEQPQELQESTEEVETNHEPNETHEDAAASPEAPESVPPVAEEPEWTPQPYEPPKVAAPDIANFVQPDGTLDLPQYNQAQQAWADQVVQAAVQAATQVGTQTTAYQREWSKAEDKFPELKNNKQLKDMVQAIHANSAQPGFKYLSPTKAAEQLFAIRGEAKSEGMKAAQESRTVQAAAGLSKPNPPATSQSDNRAAIKERMRTGTKIERAEATREYLKLIL